MVPNISREPVVNNTKCPRRTTEIDTFFSTDAKRNFGPLEQLSPSEKKSSAAFVEDLFVINRQWHFIKNIKIYSIRKS